MAEEDVRTLQVKKYTFLGASVSDELAVTDSLLEIMKKLSDNKKDSDEEEDEDSAVKWLRVERLKKSGKQVIKTLDEWPPDVHSQIKENSDCSFQYLIDAGGLMKEVDPKLRVSALATGLGAYIIAFPLDSFAEDVPETSKLDLVREICDSVGVIGESASHPNKVLDKYDSKPQVILLGTHRGTINSTEVARRQKVASDLLRRELLGGEAKYNVLRVPESGKEVWAIDVSKDSSLEEMWVALDDEVDEVEVPVRHSWIEAYVSYDDKRKAKRLSKPVSKQKYQEEIEKALTTKLTEEEFEKLFDVFHLLGRLVTHENYVFSQTYLCEIFQCLSKKKGNLGNNLEAIRTMLVDKGLAVNFSDGECVAPSVFAKYNGNPLESAAPFYLAIVKGFSRIRPITFAEFWRMITAVQAKESDDKKPDEESWDCDTPEHCDYICLHYDTFDVHVSLVGKVIKVAVEKYANDSRMASNMKKFAKKCQEIQKSLLNALEKIIGNAKGNKVRWGFACERDQPTKDSSSPCISVTTKNTVDPDDYSFKCPFNRDHQPRLTLRHKVWFLTKIPEGHQLVKDNGIWTVPESVNQPANDPPSISAPFDSDEFNRPPSDCGLQGVVDWLGADWSKLAISLGIPCVHLEGPKENLDKVKALTYWRDGRSGQGYDTTWTFLLKKVSENVGSNVADDLKKEAVKNYPSWWKLGSTD